MEHPNYNGRKVFCGCYDVWGRTTGQECIGSHLEPQCPECRLNPWVYPAEYPLPLRLTFAVDHPGEPAAGLPSFTDTVTVEVESGDPGGEEGEFTWPNACGSGMTGRKSPHTTNKETTMLNANDSSMAANAICHAAEMSQETIRMAVYEYIRPSTVHKPRLFIDGDQWCALFGENLQDGISGFGKSPREAMTAFDDAWERKLA